MTDFEDRIHIAIASTVDLVAMLANALLIYLVLRKTPKDLASYAPLVLNIAFVDFLSAFCNCMCIPRIGTFSGYMLLQFNGPCTLLDAHWCNLCMSSHAAFVLQSMFLLIVAFAYRLWMLNTSIEQKKRQGKLWIAAQIIITLFALLAARSCYTLVTYSVSGVPEDITYTTLNLSGGVAGNLNEWLLLIFELVPIFIGMSLIVPIRRRLVAQVSTLRSRERREHAAIYRSLTLQMLLPLAHVVGGSLWILDFVGIIDSQAAQRSVDIMPIIFAIGSPLINMYYIRPYKRYLMSIFSRSNRVGHEKTSISVPPTGNITQF